jgi:cellulose synthase/poly-beta-1,6-N-acetylglucosamine synthase-like glycosyltransferase
LDADFVPPPDFLRKTVAHLVADRTLGMVQTRWGHLNAQDNLLTWGQTLALDGHFVVEQNARNKAGWLMNFNGTGGVWRVAAIHEAGGWKDTTLTEDLDLSYRAQLIGWRFLYLNDVVVPGELPPQIAAYRQQQARWAKGGTQCMSLLLPSIWRSTRLSFMQKLMATMHLSQYLVHPMIMLMLILTPWLLLSNSLQQIALGPLSYAGLIPVVIYLLGQYALYPDWSKRILAMPALIALGTSMSWSNASAVMSGLLGVREEFKRTPKYAAKRTGNRYAIKLNTNVYYDLFFCCYAVFCTVIAVKTSPTFVLYPAIYALAFGTVVVWGVRDYLRDLR